MNPGKKFLSDLKLYSDYLKYSESLGRIESYNEAVDSILDMHLTKYGTKINPFIEDIRQGLYNMEFLASQRNLQYRGESIFKHNARLYNCSTTYAYSPDLFGKAFYILLCGCGLGVSIKNKYVQHLPIIEKRNESETITHIVEDSIEGWADAVRALISSFCLHPSLDMRYFLKKVVFDFSKIRPKGSYISGGFKAPGPDGLRQSLERIENLLTNNPGPFRSILVYDTLMHIGDAVLSGGVRRSAMSVIIDPDDHEMINAKTGNWFISNPQRARSNNSVGLLRNSFSLDDLKRFISINQGDNDLGFVFMNHEDEVFNPCFEIGFNFFNQISDFNESVFQFCNLNEINATACVDEAGNFSEKKFYQICRQAAILGTLQAGYTSFPYLGKQTERVVEGEALLGISITGWMTRPELFDPRILENGAKIVLETNKLVANVIGINPAARTTTVKPSGNASVILGTASGIHPEHSKRYFRIMQLNKESDTAIYLKQHMPELLEESRWSATNSDYVVFIPVENDNNTLFKDEMKGVKHLKLIQLVQQHWVANGKRKELCYNPSTSHNVSNTVIIDDIDSITQYLFDNQKDFTAVSFVSSFSDKDYNQAPFTSVLNGKELLDKYGDGVIFMSGLIVDALHYFNNNLWDAVDFVTGKNTSTAPTRDMELLRQDFKRRTLKFAKNFFQNDLQKTLYCMKDVHLYHKWMTISRVFKNVDFQKVLTKPNFRDTAAFAATACNGGACELVTVQS